MPRPRKEGLDYFSLDTNFFSADPNIKILRSRYSSDGIVLYLYLLCEIYREHGYYLEYNEDLEFLIMEDLKMSQDKVRQVMKYLFSRSLLQKIECSKLVVPVTIITSTGIQKRFQLMVKSRAVKTAVEVERGFWLLSPEETEPFIKFKGEGGFSKKNEGFSKKNEGFSSDLSLKKSKEKESKEKNNIAPPARTRTRKKQGFESERSYDYDEIEKSLLDAGRKDKEKEDE